MDKQLKKGNDKIVSSREGKEVKVQKAMESSWKSQNFFNVQQDDDTTLEIFEDLQLTRRIQEFINHAKSTTIFTYGQTGSGKTYSMFGNYTELLGKKFSCLDPNFEMHCEQLFLDGIAQITIKNIFNCINMFMEAGALTSSPKLELQVQQIQNDDIKDLISTKDFVMQKVKNDNLRFDNRRTANSNTQQCKLKADGDGNYQVDGATRVQVESIAECMWFVSYALENLINRASQMNHQSTRGHCCFSFKITTNDGRQGNFTFIDLAGSEKFNKQEINSLGSQECRKINNSLFVLRKVISILSYNSEIEKDDNASATPSKNSSRPKVLNSCKDVKQSLMSKLADNKREKKEMVVPQRESLITKILKSSMEADGHIIMVANLSPNQEHFEENMSTLEWASKASKISIKSRLGGGHTTVQELQKIIDSLKNDLNDKDKIIREKDIKINQLKLENNQLSQLCSQSNSRDLTMSLNNSESTNFKTTLPRFGLRNVNSYNSQENSKDRNSSQNTDSFHSVQQEENESASKLKKLQNVQPNIQIMSGPKTHENLMRRNSSDSQTHSLDFNREDNKFLNQDSLNQLTNLNPNLSSIDDNDTHTTNSMDIHFTPFSNKVK